MTTQIKKAFDSNEPPKAPVPQADTPPVKPEKETGIVTSASRPATPTVQQPENRSTPATSGAENYQAPGTGPATTEVNAETDTVESRLNSLTDGSSRYINQARKDAVRTANSRGLINSSMAAGAGAEAAIREARPIAEADANTYNETRLANNANQNEFLRNQQSAELNQQVASHEANLQRDTAAQQNVLDINRDNNSAALNEHLAAFESNLAMNEEEWSTNLQTQAEMILNDAKFSDETKLQYVTAMNTIIRDAQDQVVQIGLSDRTADQQAAAIQLVNDNRDASLAVYQDLLGGFNDWEWGTDFTPEQQNPVSQIPAGAISDGRGGYYWPEANYENGERPTNRGLPSNWSGD